MATYDNGLYTPWTPADQAQPAATTHPVETATTQWWTSPSSSTTTSTVPMTTSTTSSAPPTTSSTTVQSSSTSQISSSSPLPSSSSSLATSSATSTPSSTRSIPSQISSATSSSSTLRPSGVIAASSSDSSSSPSFKITYLLPVFIIVPCVLLFLLAAWTYGKYWAKPRSDGSSSGRPQDQPGFWDGAYKSIGTKSRKPLPEDEDEKDGLVIGKDWSNGNEDIESATPKRKQSSKWTNWLPLGRGNSTRSNGSSQSYNHVPFVSVSYASLDQPFVPPSNSSAGIARSTSQMSNSNKDRGWTWGTKPQATTSALRVMNGDERDEDSQHLTTGGAWGVGSTSRKYRAKSARSKNGSISSRISDRIKNSLSPGGFGPNDTAPSPSVYSPQFSPQGQQAYAELDEEEEDDDGDSFIDEKKVDLDAYLGQSRVGHGGTANRYLNGDPTAVPPPRRSSGRPLPPGAGMQEEDQIKNDYYARQQGGGGLPRSSTVDSFGPPRRQPPPVAPIFPVSLPSAPPRTQVSPKKSQSTLLRAPPSSEPRATPPPQLLFGYDSPPPPAPRGPLPIPSSQSRSQLANDPFTSPPARVPFRSQAAPQLSRPPRGNGTSTPFSPETAPALFFASPPLASPPSSQGHHHYSNVVGSPMPDFQPGALRASESAFSLQGVDTLIFTDPSRSESRTGLKELVQKPKSRKEEIDQLRRSVGPSASSIPAHSQPTPSPLRNDPIVSGFKKITTRPMNDKRESLGFDPQFSESPSLAPLQHPSKVRAAIENLESKSTHSKHSSIDSTRSGRSQQSSSKPERMPSPPSPQKLERSTTTLGRSRRHGGFDSDPEHSQGEEEEDEDLIKHRRVSTLLLSRSRTQSGPASGGGGGGAVSSSSHEGSTEEDHGVRPPLSSDSKRLSMMLRRKSTGPFPPMADEVENNGEDMLKAMTRRSGLFD